MPRFTRNPPIFEARVFTGGDDSALDIQGWMLAHNVKSHHSPGGEIDGERLPDEIEFQGNTLTEGEWLMWDGGKFQVLTSSGLFENYTMVP